MDAVGSAARAIRAGEAELMIAGGVESMSRAPFVMPKAETAFSRSHAVYDTTIGWRFVNRLMKERCGVDSMPVHHVHRRGAGNCGGGGAGVGHSRQLALTLAKQNRTLHPARMQDK
jgi:acetyl-CoA acetyltransferase